MSKRNVRAKRTPVYFRQLSRELKIIIRHGSPVVKLTIRRAIHTGYRLTKRRQRDRRQRS